MNTPISGLRRKQCNKYGLYTNMFNKTKKEVDLMCFSKGST